MIVTQLWIYPVKGMRGTQLSTCALSDRGLVDDRRWMLVDAAGVFMSQRKHAVMAQIGASAQADALVLEAPGMQPLTLPRAPAPGPSRRVQIWDSICAAQSMGAAAARWLRAFLHVECDLVYMPDSTHRAVSPKRGRPGDIVSFADGYPILITNEASLAELNTRLDAPVDMLRFRPNIVVQGAAAWAEDDWRRIDVGAVPMRVAKPCGRCVVVNVNQHTAHTSKEPLRTLATYRRQGKSVIFGQNVIPDAPGGLRVGDAVTPHM